MAAAFAGFKIETDLLTLLCEKAVKTSSHSQA
jgi:hypothetical protein